MSRRNRRFEWWRGDRPEGMVLLILESKIEPGRTDDEREHGQGRWFKSEVERAKSEAAEWADAMLFDGLELPEVRTWITTLSHIDARQAGRWNRAGFRPEELRLRLWYGEINEARPPLEHQIAYNMTSERVALDWVRKYREQRGPTAITADNRGEL